MSFKPTKLIVVTGLLAMGKNVVMSILDKLSIFQYANSQDYTFHLIELNQLDSTPKSIINYLSDRFVQLSGPIPIVGTSRFNEKVNKTFFHAEDIRSISAELLNRSFTSVDEAWFEFYRQAVSAFQYKDMLNLDSDSIAIMPRKIEPTIESFENSLEGYRKYFKEIRFVFVVRDEISWINTRMLWGIAKGRPDFYTREIEDYRSYVDMLERWNGQADVCVVRLEDVFEDPLKMISELAGFLDREIPKVDRKSQFEVSGATVDWDTLFTPTDDNIAIIPQRLLRFSLLKKPPNNKGGMSQNMSLFQRQMLQIVYKIGKYNYRNSRYAVNE